MVGFLLPTYPEMPWLHYNWLAGDDSSLVAVIEQDVVAVDAAAVDIAVAAGKPPCLDHILPLEEEVDDLT